MNPLNLAAGVIVVATALLLPFSPIPLSLPWGFFYVAPVSVATLSLVLAGTKPWPSRALMIVALVVLIIVIIFAALAASSSQIGSMLGPKTD